MPSFAALVAVAALTLSAPRPAAQHLAVIVPDRDNLQHLAFWVAIGAGDFEAEGLELELLHPDAAAEAEQMVRDARAPAAVLSPPMYLRLIADELPIVLAANLMQNDAINLVVRPEVAKARGLSAKLPLVERLEKLRGLKIGIAPGPPSRLRALLALAHMNADEDVELVIMGGPNQNTAFEQKTVDALYCHTPFLEKALLEQGAVLIVDQSGGEVPALTHRQIHALSITRAFAEQDPAGVQKLVRAIARAEKLIHGNPRGAVAALRKAQPKLDEEHARLIVRLYAPAIPETPAVSAEGVQGALAFFPANSKAPDLSKIDLSRYVLPGPGPAAAHAK